MANRQESAQSLVDYGGVMWWGAWDVELAVRNPAAAPVVHQCAALPSSRPNEPPPPHVPPPTQADQSRPHEPQPHRRSQQLETVRRQRNDVHVAYACVTRRSTTGCHRGSSRGRQRPEGAQAQAPGAGRRRVLRRVHALQLQSRGVQQELQPRLVGGARAHVLICCLPRCTPGIMSAGHSPAGLPPPPKPGSLPIVVDYQSWSIVNP